MTLWILCLTLVNGFFFGGGSNCNCPPPAPPPVCPSSCDGYPAQAAAALPPPPVQTYSQGGSYYPQQQQYQYQNQAQGSYVLPEVHTGNQIVAPPTPTAFIQSPPVEPTHDLAASKGAYVNPNAPSKNGIRYESLEPPTPPSLSSKHIEVGFPCYIKFIFSFQPKNKNDLFPDYDGEGDAIIPPITTSAPEFSGYDKAQNQIEVAPNPQHREAPFDKLPDNEDLISKAIRKVENKMTTTTTGTPSIKTANMAMSVDAYEDKLPDIDGLNESSSKSKLKMNDVSFVLKIKN